MYAVYNGKEGTSKKMMARTYDGSAWSENYQIISDHYANSEDTAHGNGNILATVWNGRYSDENVIFFSYLEAPSVFISTRPKVFRDFFPVKQLSQTAD